MDMKELVNYGLLSLEPNRRAAEAYIGGDN